MLLIGRERGKGQIGKIPRPSPSKSGKSQKNRESPKKGQKRTKKEGQVQIGKPPRLKHPHLAALEFPSASEHATNNKSQLTSKIRSIDQCMHFTTQTNHRRGVCQMRRNDNFVNVFVLVVLYFPAGQSSVFQFITQPPGWCWGRHFPVKCNFRLPRCICLLLCIQDYKLVSESAANRLLILFRGGCTEDSQGLFLGQACGALEGNSMEGMKCYSGLRCLALLNYPVYGPVHRPVYRTLYETHLFLANPTSLLSLIFALFTLPLNSRTRPDLRARVGNASGACHPSAIWRKASPIAGEKNLLQ